MSQADDRGAAGVAARGITRVPIFFVNAYLIDVNPDDPNAGWVLFDTGLAGVGRVELQSAAARRYGGRAPRAIILSHGHFDHAGSARRLAELWNVPVYAHPLELPYLTGRSHYPPPDPTVGGAFAMMSRTFPYRALDLGAAIRALPEDGSVPELTAGARCTRPVIPLVTSRCGTRPTGRFSPATRSSRRTRNPGRRR